MPAILKNNWLYAFVFTLLIAGGGLLYLNQQYPVVLSDEDTDFTGFDEIQIIPSPSITTEPTPFFTPDPTPQLINLDFSRLSELKNAYSSVEEKASETLKLSASDTQKIKKTILLTEARYRNLLVELNLYIDRIEDGNNKGYFTYRDLNVMRDLITSSRYKTEQISTSLDALKSANSDFENQYDIKTTLDNLIILTDQINASFLDVISSLQLVNPPN